LLQDALTHKSFINEQKTTAGSHNERLEFVGDAVLSLVISEQLAALLPQSTEGVLSKHKARLVSESMLAQVARHLRLARSYHEGAKKIRCWLMHWKPSSPPCISTVDSNHPAAS
jgi:ribonuclease-3